MLYEGNVLACIQLVDNISIATSTNFMIHVLIDPNDGSRYIATDDFSEFQQAVIEMATLSDEMRQQMDEQRDEFSQMQIEFINIQQIADDAKNISEEARRISEESLQIAQNALDTIIDLTDLAREARDIASETKNETEQLNQEVEEIKNRMDREEGIVDAINRVAESALEIARAIEEKTYSYVSKEEMQEAILTAKAELNILIQETKETLERQIAEDIGNIDDRIEIAKQEILQELEENFSIQEF